MNAVLVNLAVGKEYVQILHVAATWGRHDLFITGQLDQQSWRPGKLMPRLKKARVGPV